MRKQSYFENKPYKIPIQKMKKKFQHMLLFIYRRAWLMGAIKKTSNGVERRRACGDWSAAWRVGRGRGAAYWSGAHPRPSHPLGRHYRSTLASPATSGQGATQTTSRHPIAAYTTRRNHTPFSCDYRVTGFSNSIYSVIESQSTAWLDWNNHNY